MTNIIIFTFFISLFSINSFAITCVDDDIDLNPGDVISADMIKDIFDRISGVSSGMTPEELDGTWICETQDRAGGSDNGFTPNSDGIGSSMTQEIDFSIQSDDTFLVSYENSFYSDGPDVRAPFVCRGKLNSGALFNMIDIVVDSCSTPGIYPMRRISKSCFVWNASNSYGGVATTCQKKSLVPLAPTDLSATLSVSGTSGVVSLSWTAGDSNTDNYTIKAKTSNNGTYSDLTTELSGTTYTDTISSGTKWYRVYGVNASGTSTGSNVVSISYSE